VVAAIAAIAEVFEPRSFSGLFGAAPSVAIALTGFAGSATLTGSRWPPVVVLPVATALWLVIAVLAWRVVLARRS
jgi:hypothetical protein